MAESSALARVNFAPRDSFLLCGDHPGESIEFFAAPEISDAVFDVTVTFGDFRIEEDGVVLLQTRHFIDELRLFERSRRTTAELEGTSDFRLWIGPHQRGGDALVRFSITQEINMPAMTIGACRLDGGFIVPDERVPAMIEGLAKLLEHCWAVENT